MTFQRQCFFPGSCTLHTTRKRVALSFLCALTVDSVHMLQFQRIQCVTQPQIWQLDMSYTNGERNDYRASDVIRSGARYAKWAGGSRSQTHRRAAKDVFTQDDGYVRGLAPTHDPPSLDPCCTSFSLAVSATIIQSSIPIPVPGQYRLSRCLE